MASRLGGGPPDVAVVVGAKTGRSNCLEILERCAVKDGAGFKSFVGVKYLI